MSRGCRRIIFWVLGMLYAFGVCGEEGRYYFKHLGIDNGMSQNTVMCIIQDQKGFMWFGTKDGLNRYDGIRFKIFSPDNTQGNLKDCIINSLCESSDGRIWAGTDMGLSVYDPATERFAAFDVRTVDSVGVMSRVRDVCEDNEGRIWIADEMAGVFCYVPETGVLTRPRTENADFVRLPLAILADNSGVLWVGTSRCGFYYYDAKAAVFRDFQAEVIDMSQMEVVTMLESGREMYLGTFNNGLWKLNKETRRLSPLLMKDEQGNPLHVRRLIKSDKDKMWIATEVGLYIYDEQTNLFTHLQQSYTDRYALSDNAIYSFCKDKEGGMWFGTYFGGVNYMPFQYTPFNKFYPLNDGKSVSGKAVREFCEDADGNIWIGTEDAGLNRFDPKTGEFKHYQPGKPGGIHYHNIHALQMDKDRLWVGTYTGGLDLLHLKSGMVKHYGSGKAPAEVFSFLKDRTGRMWLGSFSGVYGYRPEQDDFQWLEDIGNYFIYDIKEDYSGNIWFAAFQMGVIRYNPVMREVTRFMHSPGDRGTAPFKVTGIFEDSRRRLWFGSEGEGLCRFDPKTETFVRYTVEDGLPNSVVYYITEDLNGMLWFGTNRGLVRFDPESGKVKIYTRENGLLCDQFNYKSAFTAKDGTIYMGTINGFISFDPSVFRENVSDFCPILTGFQIFNEEVPIGGNSPLKESISQVKDVKLKYYQNTLSFDFASLNFNTPEVHFYAYRLDGLDKDWITLKQNQKITYSNLSPGSYTLRIKTLSGSDKECRLGIVVTPPFWLSGYAYFLYFLLLVAGVYLLFRLSAKQIREKHMRSMLQLENEKEKEAYDAKIGFFTNVAHEVRTPLSLIKGPLEHILKEDRVDGDTKDDLLVMQRNTDRLLSLINQLLDFRKTESGKFSMAFVHCDVSSLLTGVYERFIPAFRQGNLKFRLQMPENHFFADVDSEAFTKMVSNLFTNGVKFASSYVEVELSVVLTDLNCFRVVVKNDGKLIPEELFGKIFEPFFRLNEKSGENTKTGTGIGLPLSRSLAELHNGRLYVEKRPGECNTFVLELPIHQEGVVSMDRDMQAVVTTEVVSEFIQEKVKSEKYSVLVAEDNVEMQDFIYKQLSPLYSVYRAGNGKEALEILDEEHVDIIVSDIVMPEMDGFVLLKSIKSDVKNSHIPVILLTARTNLQSKIEGLELGADAYIEKPFSMDYLSVQIANLLDGRKKLRDSFIKSPYLHSNTIALTKADEEFMEKINGVVEQNLENVDFNIDQLAGAMNMSRSSLLRKIKGISELTANEYIRLVRLKKAVQLLEEGKYRINEICFLTGFSSSSYFAKCFQKQFGMLPKDFVGVRKEKKE